MSRHVRRIERVETSVSSCAVRQAQRSQNAWAQHVKRVVSRRDVMSQVKFGLEEVDKSWADGMVLDCWLDWGTEDWLESIPKIPGISNQLDIPKGAFLLPIDFVMRSFMFNPGKSVSCTISTTVLPFKTARVTSQLTAFKKCPFRWQTTGDEM